MWKINNQIKITNDSELAAALTLLRQNPNHPTTMISFHNTDNPITYLINEKTFPNYDVNIFQAATNIKVWQLNNK